MTNATCRSAFRVLEDDFEAATARLRDAVESVASEPSDVVEELNDLIDEILEGSEKGRLIVIERAALEALRVAPSDVSGEFESAFENFAWGMRRALREFKQALTRETAERAQPVGASP
jgi:hypothetical protein